MPGGDDDEEIAAERPHYGAEHGKLMPEVEGTHEDVESKQVHKHVPHVVGQPQVVCLHHLAQGIGALVRRRHLVRGHTAEGGVGPARALARPLIILLLLHSCSTARRGIMAVENPALDVGRQEIGEGDNGKQNHCHEVGQVLLQ